MRSDITARIQWIRGMCSDESPHTEIDAALADVLTMLDGLTVAWVRDVGWTHPPSTDFEGCTE